MAKLPEIVSPRTSQLRVVPKVDAEPVGTDLAGWIVLKQVVPSDEAEGSGEDGLITKGDCHLS